MRRTPSGVQRRSGTRRAEVVSALLVRAVLVVGRAAGTSSTTSPPARGSAARARTRVSRSLRVVDRDAAVGPAPRAGAARSRRSGRRRVQRSLTGSRERREVRALLAAAGDQVDAAREGADADLGRRHVGRLRVVDVGDAVDRRRSPRAGARRPRRSSSASRTAAGSSPRARQTAAAAIAFSRLCGPRRRISAAAISGSPRQHSVPSRWARSGSAPAAPRARARRSPRGRSRRT